MSLKGSPMTPIKLRYKCPECGLIETEDYKPRELRRPIIHLCWFCLLKGEHIQMEVTSER